MAIQYGVLRARLDRFKREDNASTPHLQIRAVDTSGQPWRIAVNVQSDSGSEVAFWVVDPLAGHPLLRACDSFGCCEALERRDDFSSLQRAVGGLSLSQKPPLCAGEAVALQDVVGERVP